MGAFACPQGLRQTWAVNMPTIASITTAAEVLDQAPDGFLLLLAPSSNRVYAGEAARLNAAEIAVMASAFGVELRVSPVVVAGVAYLSITGGGQSRLVTRLVSEASGAFALFDVREGLLSPMPLDRRRVHGDDLVSIQKYQGKTNEQFTHLLLNVTASLARRAEGLLEGSFHVLDPMCGRGTTLNTCLMRGFDVTGVDIDKKDFEAYQAFITTWLRSHRLKHAIDATQVRRAGRTFGRALELETAADKEAWKAGQTQQVTYLNVDTRQVDRVMRRASVDVVVADTPYGVQHGSHGERLDRSPVALLERALPSWCGVLRTGGTLGLAYNRHVAAPSEMAEVLTAHGLSIVHGAGAPAAGLDEDAFRHRVDASIDRDIVVARKE